MNEYDTKEEERTDLEPRTRRAVTEYISILGDAPGVVGADDLYLAVSESGESYRLDGRSGACECPDAEYHEPEGGCKHVRRLEVIEGERPDVVDAIDADDVDPQLGTHVTNAAITAVDFEATVTSSEAAHAIATDGGTTVREASEGAEVLEDDEADPWKGPFAEYDKYGQPTGAKYHRCRDCGREVVTDAVREHVEHREGCRFADDDDEDDRDTPRRSEPADFGGGESTGVVDL